jgi:hypothetical protein
MFEQHPLTGYGGEGKSLPQSSAGSVKQVAEPILNKE